MRKLPVQGMSTSFYSHSQIFVRQLKSFAIHKYIRINMKMSFRYRQKFAKNAKYISDLFVDK